jgi:hypothetical protein
VQSLEDWWFEAPVFIEAGVQRGDRVFVFGPVGSGLRTALANADATAINPARGAAENFELLLDKLALELGATVVCVPDGSIRPVGHRRYGTLAPILCRPGC